MSKGKGKREMDDLTRIERAYGCVAEYQRCMEEEDEREMKRALQAEENKRKLEREKGNVMYFCDGCVGCKHYESIGPTNYTREMYDDVEHGICRAERKCEKCEE